eukprot:CAMPEP_0168619228 /NCGR_PEP_ID=MMETSP0449_2-20121227/6489_1 /TAXON_ID=1082188 /ORGANISM="Strombidium rassoulzadegani, Strain ras09" /LENGTH=195 /DNA_ID=CAMNT_0008660147 /DNA_START=492 /DNA_END=1079 /DNA_ORIENTATION=-
MNLVGLGGHERLHCLVELLRCLFLLTLLSLVLNVRLLVIDHFEAFKSALGSPAALTGHKVGPENLGPLHLADAHLLISLESESRSFLESLSVGERPLEIVDAVEELTPVPIHANTLLVELGAQLGLEVGWHVCLLLQLVLTVGVGAARAILALAVNFEIPAKFGLLLALVLVLELVPLLVGLEVLLLGHPSGLAE